MISYNQFIDQLRAVSLLQPNARTFTSGNIYKALNANKRIRYNVINWTLTDITESDGFTTINGNLFYVSRLDNDLESNEIQIQSIGMQQLSNIVRTLENEFEWQVINKTYTPFTQQFADECSGAYVTLSIEIPDDWCYEEYGEIRYKDIE